MKKLYLIPEYDRINESLELADQYKAGFEYNDFYDPMILDDERKIDHLIEFYKKKNHNTRVDTMHGAFLDVTVHSKDRLIREASMFRVRQSMKIAKNLGLRSVIFHTGRLAGFQAPHYINHWLKANEEFFREILSEFPEQEIYMENMFDETPDMLAKFACQMKDETRFGVCLDYAHAVLTQESGEKWIKTLAPYIRHIHINDNDMHNDLHLPLGAGDINWMQMRECLEKNNVNASVLLEVNGIEEQKRSIGYLKEKNILFG